jgi:MFS transporter, FSR family, fosmidomycin resistance protein
VSQDIGQDEQRAPARTAAGQPPAAISAVSAPAEAEFDTAAVGTVATAHFVHDTYPAFVGTLLPLLIDKHGMSLAVAGGLATMIRWPSVAQPFLGYVADRTDARLLVILPPVVTAVAISLLGVAPTYTVLAALLLIAGASSAAFHPAAGAMVTRASGTQWGRASSYFMTGGELGRAVGPILIASTVAAVGLTGSWIAALPGLAVTGLAYALLRSRALTLGRSASPDDLIAAVRSRRRPLLLLAGIVLFRSLVIASFQTYVPTFLVKEGTSLLYAGFALTVYEAGGVLGAFVGGPLSDRFGRRTTMAASQATAGPILFGALLLAKEPVGIALLAVGGLLALSAGPVQLTLVQELLPRNRSAAAGIVMFLGFEGQVIAVLAMGFLADQIGLGSALAWSVLASMLSLPFTLLLPETRSG